MLCRYLSLILGSYVAGRGCSDLVTPPTTFGNWGFGCCLSHSSPPVVRNGGIELTVARLAVRINEWEQNNENWEEEISYTYNFNANESKANRLDRGRLPDP